MPSAAVVYWFSKTEIQKKPDGGGLRALAWERALTDLGYEVSIHPLMEPLQPGSATSWLSSLKKLLIPMPFLRETPEAALDADIVVAAALPVFGDSLRRVRPDRLILDWMDLWSTWSRNVGDSSVLSRPGGRMQARVWKSREIEWSARANANSYAGYEDLRQSSRGHGGAGMWMPTPIELGLQGEQAQNLRSLGFIGNLDYLPNELSLRAFLNGWSARLASQNVRLKVAGFGSEKVAEWGYGVEVVGAVEVVDEFYRDVDAAVVPIEHGGGVKVKAIEALAHGKPVFTTPHVRAGVAPPLRPMLRSVDELNDVAGIRLEPVDVGLFDSYFSPQAFRRSAEILCGRLTSRGESRR